ncbi:MAG: TIGR01244 family sulfur transferase [Pseudomonadota bacterium]
MTTNPSRTLEMRRLADDFAVSGQIWPEQVSELVAAGFKAVICNRPDGEAPDQPTAASIEQAVKDAGLSFYNIPVSPAGMTYENVDQTKAALAEIAGPVFAYCRSGARSTNIWQFLQDQGKA